MLNAQSKWRRIHEWLVVVLCLIEAAVLLDKATHYLAKLPSYIAIAIPAVSIFLLCLIWVSARHSFVGQLLSAPSPKNAFRNATPDELPQILALDRHAFHKADVVPENTLRSWLEANPGAFRVLVKDGCIVAYYSLLPLIGVALNKFRDGIIKERKFRKADILSEAQARHCANRLLFSVVVREEYRGNPRIVRTLTKDIAHQLHDSTLSNKLAVYATGATDRGQEWLQRAGFSVEAGPSGRKDHHPLYVKHLQRDEIDREESGIWRK